MKNEKLYESLSHAIQEIVIGESKSAKLGNAHLVSSARDQAKQADELASMIKKNIPTDTPSGKKLHKMISELKKISKFLSTTEKLLVKAESESGKLNKNTSDTFSTSSGRREPKRGKMSTDSDNVSALIGQGR